MKPLPGLYLNAERAKRTNRHFGLGSGIGPCIHRYRIRAKNVIACIVTNKDGKQECVSPRDQIGSRRYAEVETCMNCELVTSVKEDFVI